MNAVSKFGCSPRSADLLVFSSSENVSAHAELLSICERLASVWGERAQSEHELWKDLALGLAATSNVADALQAFSENAAQRMRIALENVQKIFEEQQKIAARFSRPQD